MRVVRIDEIVLDSNTTANRDEFEKFIRMELFAFFKDNYSIFTRRSRAVLEDQLLVRDARDEQKYFWLMTWDGDINWLQDPDFEDVQMMNDSAENTAALLERLASFGKRTPGSVLGKSII